jgi:hypothetical protein
MPTAKLAALLAFLCACGGDDAAPHDAITPDIDNGACGTQLRFTGEYIDWDSGTAFCGILGAQFQVQGDSVKKSTAPNGRFDLCVPNQAEVLVDVTPPAMLSECAQQGAYVLPAIAVANKAVIEAGGFWSGRAFGMARQSVDAAKAQVFVHVNGAPRELSLAAAHGAAQAMVNGAWAPGSTGPDVFFPDVDPSGGSTTLSVSGNAIGTGAIPLVAGKMTTLSIVVP